ncbi:MAG: efflux RND transporter periplasmic adaptor subunit [Phycisphaerae bacterium]|nr:efflux RND transporter periplasmic adaptor subunit [Phycisphaerae bacterium]
MADLPDHAVLDVRQLRPKLRRDISITEQIFRGESWFIVQDPITCQFFRLGPAEYRFIRELDGKRPVGEILQQLAGELGEDTLSPELAARLLNYLQQTNLLETHEQLDPASLYEAYRKARRKRGLQTASNFLFINLPLVDPDKFLRRTLPYVRPLLGRGFFVVWLAAILAALGIVVTHWQDLVGRANSVLAPSNLFLLYVAFAFVKLFHEMWHGYTCRRFGGPVHEMGILFLVFTPFFYCEASSAWAFDSKWKKIFVSAGGMYIELFLASIATFVWFATNPGVVHSLAYNVVFVASVSTLLFNGNPLLRYDGYYILSDLLELPNLWTNANNYMKYLITRYLLGSKQESPAESIGQAAMFLTYGVASFCYRILVCVGIILFVSKQLKGLGLALAVGAVVAWVVVPLGKAVKHMFFTGETRSQRARSAWVMGGLVTAAVILLCLVPLPMRLYTTAAVDYREVQVVRADAPGHVAEVLVRTGQRVVPGQPVVRLTNETLAADLRRAKADLALVKHQYAALEVTDVAAAMAVKPSIEARQNLVDDLTRKTESLTLYSTTNGMVITGRLNELVGQFKDVGQELMMIADTDHPLLKAAIDQEDVYEYRDAVGDRVEIRLRRRPAEVIEARIDSLAPQSGREIPHPALTSKAGEDLVIDPAAKSDGPKLLYPCFVAELVPTDPNLRLPGGAVARVRFNAVKRPLASQWYRKAVRLIRTLWL